MTVYIAPLASFSDPPLTLEELALAVFKAPPVTLE